MNFLFSPSQNIMKTADTKTAIEGLLSLPIQADPASRGFVIDSFYYLNLVLV